MPAAQVCRACCTRLKPSVTWSRRTSLALRQTPIVFRTLSSIAVDSNSQPLPTTRYYEDDSKPDRSDGQYVPQNAAEASPAGEQQRPRLKLTGATLSQALGLKPKEKPPSRKTSTKESSQKSKVGSHAPFKDEQSQQEPWSKGKPRKRGMSQAERLERKLREQTEKERYMKYGWFRRHYSKDELPAARDEFIAWNQKLRAIRYHKDSWSWCWKEDGEFLFTLDSALSMRKAWEALDVEERKKKWPAIMLSTLQFCPDKMLEVLDATLNPLPPGYAIKDVLKLIIRSSKQSKPATYREGILEAERVLDIFTKVIEDLPKGYVPLEQRMLGKLCQKLPSDLVEELYRILKRNDFQLHRHTLLHIASPLAAQPGTKDTAFEIMRGIADQGVDLNQSHTASVITTLLHTNHASESSSKTDSAFSPHRALEYFIEKGFSPNVISITGLLESLCVQGDVAEAIRLPLLLAETGVELDARCAATVFRGAKGSLKVENLKGALDVAKAAKASYVDVLNNALHSIFYFAEMESRNRHVKGPWVTPLFGTMLRLYAKKFDLGPLQWLVPDTLPLVLAHEHPDGTEKFRAGPQRRWHFRHSVVPLVDQFFSSGSDDKIQPNSTTLAIMLRAYIRSLYRPYDLLAFYSFFKSRLEEPGAKSYTTELIKSQSSIVHDTLIMSMCERRGLVRPALQVFGDMLKGSLHPSEEVDGDAKLVVDTIPVHPAPTLFTFSILLHGLFMRGEKMMAEQVLSVMREHGIEPNTVTWNTLAKGYARMQDIPRTVGVFQDLEAAGFKPDAYTFKAFSRLRDQPRALQAMERIIEENKKIFEEMQSRLG